MVERCDICSWICSVVSRLQRIRPAETPAASDSETQQFIFSQHIIMMMMMMMNE